MRLPRYGLLLSLGLLLPPALLGCAPAEAPTVTPAPASTPAEAAAASATADAPELVSPTPAPRDEISVRPGVNDSYTEDKVDWFATRFAREGREVADHQSEILEILDLQAGQSVADIGSGTGLYTRELAAAVGEGGRVYAVDVTEVFLDHVRALIEDQELTNVTPVLAAAKDVGLRSLSIDVAFMSNVYHHVEFPITYMGTVHRALKPDGRLFVADFRREDDMDDEWVREHVRAGEPTVTQELDRAGFVVVERHEIMTRNYFLELRKK